MSSTTGSPFPPIAEYAFLSDCHTGALVAPDGSIDWLCAPRFDSPSVFGSLLDRGAGYFRFAPYGINVPTARTYEPGTNVLVTTWHTPSGWLEVREALTMGPRRGPDDTTPHTRPPADDDAEHLLVRTAVCLSGTVEIEMVCEPGFDYGRAPATWTVDADGRTADANGGGQTIRLITDVPMGTEGSAVRGRHTLAQGDVAFCALSFSGSAGRPGRRRRRAAAADGDDGVLASLARPRAHPRPSAAPVRRAVGTDHQGPHVHADRRHRGRADDLAAGDPGRRAQLGLPLHLDAGLDVHAPGPALPAARHRGGRVHAVRRRSRTERRRQPADHVRHRRRARPHRDHPRRAVRIPGRPSRCGWATEPSTNGRTTSSARCSTRSCSTPSAASGSRDDSGRSSEPRPRARYGCGRTRTRASGRRAESRSTTSPRRSCAGSRWTGPRSSRVSAANRTCRRAGRRAPRRSGPTSWHTGCATTACCGSTTTPTRWTPRPCWPRTSACCPGTDERLHASVIAIADELSENGFVLRYRTDETDDGLSGKEGTFLICSFWLVSALSVVGELQRSRELMETIAPDRVPARPLRRGVRSRHRPASRQLPAGVLASGPHRGGQPAHPG